MASDKLYLYPLWVRIWHGLNAIGILVLIYTGVTLQYNTPIFELMDFGLAVNLHNIFGILVSASYLIYFIGNLVTKNSKFYRIKIKGYSKRVVKQTKFYISGIFKNQEPPYPLSEKRKFNPLQKISYVVVMYLFLPLLIITGFALLFPEIIIEEVYSVSGIFITAILHATLGFLVSIFLIIHLYVASVGKSPLKNFKSIITGWHE